jgi:two-component system, NtrC family, sensor kinase
MMRRKKYILLYFSWLAFVANSRAQNFGLFQADSLRHELSLSKDDTGRVLLITYLAEAYRGAKPDSATMYAQRGLQLAQQINYPKGEILSLLAVSVVLRELGSLPKAMEYGLKALKMAETHHLPREEGFALVRVANVHVASKNYREALRLFERADRVLSGTADYFLMGASFSLAGDVYEKMDQLDSAIYKQDQAFRILSKTNRAFLVGNLWRVYGNVYTKRGNEKLALDYFHKAVREALVRDDYRGVSTIYSDLARCQRKFNHPDSAIFYARKGLDYAQRLSYKNQEMNAAALLSSLYEPSDPKEALKYYKIANAAKDSLYSAEKVQALQTVSFEEQEKQKAAEVANLAYRNRVRQYGLLAGLGIFLVVMAILVRNNRQKQKANRKLTKTLADLKATQARLVHAEKMASLGELTAGIAHEIQNPLNFVNNFSEVNRELITEMNDEIQKGNYDEVRAIAKNLGDNQEKINHHGKRADAIVRGMLQHSRTSSGQKELTDINVLAEEYLRLAYHGLRAKDKTFNAKFEANLDQSIEKINVVPQEIGRVVLNLINNAFYTVTEKRNQGGNGYEPMVTVSTKKLKDKVEIKVKDNGNGIPEKTLNKIFQPFFTTKPAGQGTGLGLSLSYDIVTKGHGGELQVKTTETEGSEFVIILPIN